MDGLSIFAINFGILCFLCACLLLIGRQFQKATNFTFKEAFFSLFFGVILLSSVFAITKSGGKTIMLGFLLLGLFYFIENKNFPIAKAINYSDQNSLRFKILALLFGALFVFTWSYLTVIQFDEFPYHIPSGTSLAPNDYLINVIRSYYLGLTGEENYYHFFNTIDAAYNGPKPYHYLEMWTTVSVNNLFGGLVAEKFVLITTPLYHLLAFVGILALWEKYQSLRWYHVLLSAAFLFFSGLHLPFYNQIGIPNFSLPIFTHRIKMVVYYPFIFAFLLQFHKEKWPTAILLLSGLMLATVVAIPTLFGGIMLFLCYQIFTLRNKSSVWRTLGYVGTTLAFLFLFYKFTETGQFNIRATAGANTVVENLFALLTTEPQAKIVFFLTVLAKQAVLYLPLLVLGFLFFTQEKKFFSNHYRLLVLVISIVISGAAGYALFKGQKDATQLFYNPVNALLNGLLIWAVVKMLSDLKTKSFTNFVAWKHGSIAFLLLVLFGQQTSYAVKRNILPTRTTKAYSDEYLQQIRKYILADKAPTIGASIKGGKDYNSPFSKQTAAYTLGYYLAYMENGSIALQISDFDIPNIDWFGKLDRASNLFCRFVEGQKAAKTFTTIGAAQVAFIRKYDLDFVILSKNGLLREEVERLVTKRFTDGVSGEWFLVVRE